MELPMIRQKAKRLDSKRLLLFGAPKCGKTTIVSELEDCLIVDMEQGSNYVDGMIVNVNNMAEYGELMKALKKAKEETGKNPYKYISARYYDSLRRNLVTVSGTVVQKNCNGCKLSRHRCKNIT